MGKLRFYIAFYIAKIAIIVLKILRRNATYMPGKIAIKICPEFLKYIDKPQKNNSCYRNKWKNNGM